MSSFKVAPAHRLEQRDCQERGDDGADIFLMFQTAPPLNGTISFS
jgi:hypothetical protein